MSDFQITYRPADEKSARQYLAWQYEPPYDLYNCPPDQLEGSVRYNVDPANNVYAIFNRDEELIGYCSYGLDAQVHGGDYNEEALDIGLMIKPVLTGKGLGATYVADVIRYGLEKYRPQKLRVTIAAFNRRARRTWEKNGFQRTQTFRRNRDQMEFIIMTKIV